MCGATTRRAMVLVAVLAVLAVSACSGDDEPVATTLPAETTQATVTSTVPPPTTPAPITQPPTTKPAPTTTPTTPPPTPTPTTISGDPTFAELEVELPQVMTRFIDAVNVLLRDPSSPELRAQLRSVSSGPALELFLERADQYVEDGRFGRLRTDEPSRVQPLGGTVSMVTGETAVGMDGCVIDTDLQVQVGDDGNENVLSDDPDSFLIIFTFDRMADGWVVVNLAVDQEFAGEVGCG